MQHRSESRPTILVVDDDTSVRRLLCALLDQDYECTEVESAEFALAELERRHFDLVISDINMGEMSGIELVGRVTASKPDTVVMVISGNLNLDSPIEAIRNGAFDYIKKPFDLEQVEMAVARAISHGALLVSKRKYEEHLEQLVEERTGRLKYLAHHDFLTGIRNRFFFEECLTKAIAEHADNALSVVFVSMDNFRELRDTFGHRAGDQLLIDVADRLSTLTTEREIVARFGGDEFALLLTDKDISGLTAFTESIFAAFDRPFVMAEKDAYVSVSVGISEAGLEAADGLEILKNAGAALSHARK
ncbi:MAG: diguanylate cyclase, partial [Pyrinomonadaceae bacterium]